ncbi:MAG: LysE family transporter, partial [Cyanobacteria bacterium P01_F01_bin.3]
TPTARTRMLAFISGFALTLGDVKAILFYASLFPAFVNVTNLEFGDIAVVILTTITSVGGVKLIYAFAAQRIIRRLQSQKRKKIALAAGSVMIGTGAYVIVQA